MSRSLGGPTPAGCEGLEPCGSRKTSSEVEFSGGYRYKQELKECMSWKKIGKSLKKGNTWNIIDGNCRKQEQLAESK